MVNTILFKYKSLILKTKVTSGWLVFRALLHWLTIPLKLVLIASLGLFQIIRNGSPTKIQGEKFTQEELDEAINKVESCLPIFKNEWYELHVNRVPLKEEVNGLNHNTDHQSQRQAIYQYLQKLRGKNNSDIAYATGMHFNNGGIMARGYLVNGPDPKAGSYNAETTSGDMLSGASLVSMYYDEADNEMGERFVQMVVGIIKNDYALLETSAPSDPDLAKIYEAFRKLGTQMKSDRGNWQPGIETVGAQALTVLAALKVAGFLSGSSDIKNEYNKLFYRYGYGLLALFPTAYTKDRRGYYNEHNSMLNLHVLNRLSKTTVEKMVYKFAMKYTWHLSKGWYNAWYTWLLESAIPGSVSKEYKDSLNIYLKESYLSEDNPCIAYKSGEYSELQKLTYLNQMNQGEFLPEVSHRIAYKVGNPYRSGLGWYANLIALKQLTKEKKK